MKINFNWIELEGFRSVVNPMHFNLDRPGLNLIKGINGAGKTTIFEGVVWNIFGINLKDTNMDRIPSWSEIRTNKWQGTRSGICFTTPEDTYYIYRHLGYKGLTHDIKGEDYLMLFKGDDDRGHEPKMVGDYRNKAETQEAIDKLLGMDAKTFMNSILFGQRMAKLVESDNSDKRKLFETLFETEWVTEAKKKCDADIGKLEIDFSANNYAIQVAENNVINKKQSLESAKAILAGFEDNRQKRLQNKIELGTEYNDRLVLIEKGIVVLEENLKNLKYDSKAHDQVEVDFIATENSIHTAEKVQITFQSDIKATKDSVDRWDRDVIRTSQVLDKLKAKHIEEKCPLCEQELKPGNKLEINHNAEITAAKEEVTAAKAGSKKALKEYATLGTKEVTVPQDLIKKLDDLADQLGTLNDLEKRYKEIWDRIQRGKQDQEQCKRDVLRVSNEISSIENEKPPLADLTVIETAIKTEQDKLKDLEQENLDIQHDLEIVRWWSQKAFSAGGIRAFIFKAMLSQLNQNVKKYGNQLGVSLEFSIDLTKASKPFTTVCSIGDKLNKEYKEFSGGQKQKLDIALIFAMFDLISMNADMNILIMDEIFEGLSEDGETAVFDLIRGKAQEGKSVYVITHSAVLDSLYANTIQLENINGNTTVL